MSSGLLRVTLAAPDSAGKKLLDGVDYVAVIAPNSTSYNIFVSFSRSYAVEQDKLKTAA
jgi:hypothetical protein